MTRLPLSRQPWFAYIVLTGLTFVTAALGSLGSVQAGAFYLDLAKPIWAPPAWLFGPVWTFLYSAMAVAACLLWRQLQTLRHPILILYYAQLGLNGAWSWVFFYGHLGGFALINIAALLVVIAWLVKDSLRLNRIITLLLVPYFFWVCFAAMLNLVLWHANPGILT